MINHFNLNIMKQEVLNHLVGEFTDYKGLVHKVIVAVTGEVLPCYRNSKTHENEEYCVSHYTESYGEDDYKVVRRALRLGIAVCNPEDNFDEEKGKNSAVGRAMNSDPVLYATKSGIVNTALVDALLKQELEYVCANPDVIIPGYTDSRKRYEYNQKMQKEIDNLEENEKKCLEILTSSNTLQKDKLLELATFVNNRK